MINRSSNASRGYKVPHKIVDQHLELKRINKETKVIPDMSGQVRPLIGKNCLRSDGTPLILGDSVIGASAWVSRYGIWEFLDVSYWIDKSSGSLKFPEGWMYKGIQVHNKSLVGVETSMYLDEDQLIEFKTSDAILCVSYVGSFCTESTNKEMFLIEGSQISSSFVAEKLLEVYPKYEGELITIEWRRDYGTTLSGELLIDGNSFRCDLGTRVNRNNHLRSNGLEIVNLKVYSCKRATLPVAKFISNTHYNPGLVPEEISQYLSAYFSPNNVYKDESGELKVSSLNSNRNSYVGSNKPEFEFNPSIDLGVESYLEGGSRLKDAISNRDRDNSWTDRRDLTNLKKRLIEQGELLSETNSLITLNYIK